MIFTGGPPKKAPLQSINEWAIVLLHAKPDYICMTGEIIV